MKLLPIGISDFKKVIEGNYYYVDKSLFIEELFKSGAETILIPRPRRFGKTLNLSMLKYFFEKTEIDNSHLFKDLKVWQNKNLQAHQGKYPVIFLTLKSIKENTWQGAYENIQTIISDEFLRHKYALSSLKDFEASKYISILERKSNQVDLGNSILFLSKVLKDYYNKNVIILIDEYDTPIHSGYINNYYNEVINFMRSLLSTAYKDNYNLERGILTGILRTAKEGIFSGLNNLEVCTILSNKFQDKFGFTQSEVNQLIKEQDLANKSSEIQQWYNGYVFGETIIYNPWSIISCANNDGALEPYWANTSNNEIIKKIIALSNNSVKNKFELLLEGYVVNEPVIEGTIFPNIEKDDQAIWSLLLFTGYLTCKTLELNEGEKNCSLAIPNKEIQILFKGLIKDIFRNVLNTDKIKALLESLKSGNDKDFSKYLQEFIANSMSFYDSYNQEPERGYHLFVLGILVMLSDTYIIKSNREAGYGRADIILIPKDKNNFGIIIEFKKAENNENLQDIAKKALKQIKEKDYKQELKSLGLEKIKAYGIAFSGKQIALISELF